MIESSGSEPAEGASYEVLFRELQETISTLEAGGLTLARSIETFERGMALADRCAGMLEEAELRVTRVVESHQMGPDEPAF